MRNGIAHIKISGRAKTVEKFSEKAAKALDKQPDTLKYVNPMQNITDMTGVRIIVLNKGGLKDVDDTVRSLFSARERTNKGDKNLDAGTVGYESIHYLVLQHLEPGLTKQADVWKKGSGVFFQQKALTTLHVSVEQHAPQAFANSARFLIQRSRNAVLLNDLSFSRRVAASRAASTRSMSSSTLA